MTEQSALAGGASGPAIVAGKPEASRLLDYVDSGEMPRGRRPLTDAEKRRLRRWIADGAVWGMPEIDPYLATTDRRAGYDWWSLQPVRDPAPPTVRDARWPNDSIDRFVLAQLEARNLHPGPRPTGGRSSGDCPST